jgi:phosphoribosylformylglycinamidine synthase II
MEQGNYRIEIYYTKKDFRGSVVMHRFDHLNLPIKNISITDNYLLNIPVDKKAIDYVAESLTQTVTQGYTINEPYMPDFSFAIEIGYLPGVTDNISHTVRESIEDLLKIDLDHEKSVLSSITYFIDGNITKDQVQNIARELYNPLIQRMQLLSKDEYIEQRGMGYALPIVSISEKIVADTISLNVDETELMNIAREGIKDDDGSRRGPLALDMMSMNVIKDYFDEEGREPTDIELESIAQTWSEHCKHTIFAAEIDEITGGIYKEYIKEATIRIRREKGEKDFCLSVFTDNAGGIEFDENFIVSDKVETHNSPSALDPFGGSITGIVGVNRDSIGFGMASKPIANRYGFCFANPFDKKPLYRDKDESTKLLSPRRIMNGVIKGVNVGGNHSGIPTPQGFVYFDDRYKGKPLVFVGTIGLMPRVVNGKSAVTKKAMPGDNVVMVGGRVGRDGIHGATFSSEALNSGSPATAVQIGDPITQKKMSDAIVKEARDMGLYHSITDNGAGGLSCSVAEMAQEAGGFEVNLEAIPLKYPGLAPWQIWVSESQERMTLSIPDKSLNEFMNLMSKRGVEATVIGRFNETDRGIVKYNGEVIFDLDMNFLHDGLPKKKFKTKIIENKVDKKSFEEPENLTDALYDMMSRLNTASFEFISRQYDHEVQGNSVLKPLQGPGEVNGNVSVIKPLLDSDKAVVLSQGLYPSYSELDPYRMAAASIDTALRNAVSAGGSMDMMALLDNFCWCDSNNPHRLGQLKEAAKACYDYAVAYGTPFVSGKDSMFNDFRGYDENFDEVVISIPPTLLISSIGVIDSIDYCQSLDFKYENDLIYVLGETRDETGGSEYCAYMGEKIEGKAFTGTEVPDVDAEKNAVLYRAFEGAMKDGLIASSISIERGGLGIAIGRSALGGQLGFNIDLSKVPQRGVERNDTLLFSESQGRFLVSVAPQNKSAFEDAFTECIFGEIGTITKKSTGNIKGLSGNECATLDLDLLMKKYKGLFEGF